MVLADLGNKITAALGKLTRESLIDEKVVDEMLKEIGNALVMANVRVQMVVQLKKEVKDSVDLNSGGAAVNMGNVIRKAVFDSLKKLVDPGTTAFVPKKGKPNVIMFVGLQGAGKTTTVSKLAHYYKKKGFSPALIAADTYRAGAFDQLRQNATKIGVPFYGSHTEADAVKIAREGVQHFKNLNCDMIFVDTSGRHSQEEGLFKEMLEISEAVNPNNIIFVMDGSIGQAAFDQANAFKKQVEVGSVIITKLDGHSKGGGALSAVAATQSPIIFIGTGEHMDDIEPFDATVFVKKLLGMGNLKGLVETLSDVYTKDKMKEMEERLKKGKFTLRDMRENLEGLMSMGPMNKILEMMPGGNQMAQLLQGGGADGNGKVKTMLNILDSMTDQELDNDKPMNKDKDMTRILRLARGSGRTPAEVLLIFEQHKVFSKMVDKMKPFMKSQGRNNPGDMNKMLSMLPPGALQGLGGAGGISQLMKQFQGMKMPGFK
eukprot:TRINITY_DN15029_c0_g1_i1.p1 TRINITY_DN15029_c0_g1~~TRINITY_DN15029_c0_g1_i1.p1  ORF type:complete len:507 (+),score=140.90 TRINITY_DN15029_c0_g1_i1:58-1521(+)